MTRKEIRIKHQQAIMNERHAGDMFAIKAFIIGVAVGVVFTFPFCF